MRLGEEVVVIWAARLAQAPGWNCAADRRDSRCLATYGAASAECIAAFESQVMACNAATKMLFIVQFSLLAHLRSAWNYSLLQIAAINALAFS